MGAVPLPSLCPGLGAEGPSAWPGGSLGAGGSRSEGAFLVTFPWGPDTHETPAPPMDPRVRVWQGVWLGSPPTPEGQGLVSSPAAK